MERHNYFDLIYINQCNIFELTIKSLSVLQCVYEKLTKMCFVATVTIIIIIIITSVCKCEMEE